MGNQSKAKIKHTFDVFWTAIWIERQALINLKTKDSYTMFKIVKIHVLN